VLAGIAVATTQVVTVVVGGPLLVGLMRKIRSRLEGRTGPPVHQPLLDIRKLFTKERIRPAEATWLFAAGPVMLVSGAILIAVMAPLATTAPPMGRSADFFAVVFVLLLGTVGLALAALDTGTAFGGMGASRAMTIGALAEPALLVAILALAIPAHTSNLPVLVRDGLSHPGLLAGPPRLLALGAFIVVVLAEAGRLPVDNPSTHLELTMIHEAMVLEYAGPDLALVTLGESMRLVLLLGLLVNLFAPWGVATRPGAAGIAVGLVVLVAKVTLAGGGIAVFEVFTAKLRLFRLPELLAGGFVLAVLATATALVVQ
jgi:formate hydrogenlyase subunit 4